MRGKGNKKWMRKQPNKRYLRTKPRAEESKCCINRMTEREPVAELPFAADCCPCVEKLRTVLPPTVGIRDGAVQLVLTHQRVRTCSGERLRTCSGACVWGLQQESVSTHRSPVYTVHRLSRRLGRKGVK
jgi:hypothetical protein